MPSLACDVTAPCADVRAAVDVAWRAAFGAKAIGGELHLLRTSVGGKRLARLQGTLQRALGVRISLGVLMQLGTAAAVAQAIADGRFPAPSPLLQLRNGSPEAAVFIVAAGSGLVLELCDLASALEVDGSLWALQLPGIDGECAPLDSIDAIARHHVAAIEARGITGAISLLGYSFAGLVVVEMARLLRAAGRTVELVGLLDAGCCQRYWPRAALLRFALRRAWQRLAELRGMSSTAAAQHLAAQLRAMQRLRARRREAAAVAASSASSASRQYPPSPASAASAHDRAVQQSIYHIAGLPRDLQQVRNASIVAFESHAPRPVSGPLVLFKSALGDVHACDPTPVWRPLAPELHVVVVPGSHVTMVRKPHVQRLASEVTLALTRARADG